MNTGLSYGSTQRSIGKSMDWSLVIFWLLLVLIGWVSIYASIHGSEPSSIFDPGVRSGKQFIWICVALALGITLLFIIPPRTYEVISPFMYAFVLLLLVLVIFVSSDVKGSRSWFSLGPVSFQPAEISKITTSLMLATIMSRSGFRMNGRGLWVSLAVIAIPMLVIIMEKETGSALVYVGYVFMLYREGLSGWLIALLGLVILLFILTIKFSPFIGIIVLLSIISLFDCAQNGKIKLWLLVAIPLIAVNCFIPEGLRMPLAFSETGIYAAFSLWRAFRGLRQSYRWITLTALIGGMLLILSADFIFYDVLKDYQRSRIEVLLGMKEDLSGAGYNVHQSKIAIGSGGLTGKGFCQGTQTECGFIPEQSTDFIFCTIGEEWGFLGSVAVILLYGFLIFRIIRDSEDCREAFTRIYGYCIAGCFFMHLFINIGMTLGIMPVIGIPLPFMSYGGSSMCGFTIMLFIFVALYRNEKKYF